MCVCVCVCVCRATYAIKINRMLSYTVNMFCWWFSNIK